MSLSTEEPPKLPPLPVVRTLFRQGRWQVVAPKARIAFGYADCMPQLVTRLDERLLADVDALVAAGAVESRSEAVRLGLERLVDQHRRQRVGAAIVEAYRRRPQAEAELAGLDEATRALVGEEPW